MKNLSGKSVVITGASSGIGRAAAIAFAKKGSNLVLAARRVDRLESLKAEVEALGVKALVVPTDVTDLNQVQRLIDASIEHFGQIDVLVNNAGRGLLGPLVDVPIEEIARLINLNLVAATAVMQSGLKTMERQGWGVIINVSSIASMLPSPYLSVYNATKSALNMLSESVNSEYLGSQIKVVSICPGIVETEFTQSELYFGRYKDIVSPFKPTSAEWVAEKIVKAALKPKPLITLGTYVLPSAIIKLITPKLYYWGLKRYRNALQAANPPIEGEE